MLQQPTNHSTYWLALPEFDRNLRMRGSPARGARWCVRRRASLQPCRGCCRSRRDEPLADRLSRLRPPHPSFYSYLKESASPAWDRYWKLEHRAPSRSTPSLATGLPPTLQG